MRIQHLPPMNLWCSNVQNIHRNLHHVLKLIIYINLCSSFLGPYDHLFANSSWSDTWIGITLLAMSIFLLVLCLLSIVHLLNSLLAGQIAIWVRRIIDKQLPHPFGWLTNYLIMLFGCFVVMIVSKIN